MGLELLDTPPPPIILDHKPHLITDLTKGKKCWPVPAQICASDRDASLACGLPWAAQEKAEQSGDPFPLHSFHQGLHSLQRLFSFSPPGMFTVAPSHARLQMHRETKQRNEPNAQITCIRMTVISTDNELQLQQLEPHFVTTSPSPRVKETGRIAEDLSAKLASMKPSPTIFWPWVSC